MGILTPLALLFAALALPILVFYLLKLRRREVAVSSGMLWETFLQDRQANALWQRLRANLLLFLQLLLLALLVLALARPFFYVTTAARGNVVVLLDSSASMQATDELPSRFATAKAKVGDLIDALGAGDRMTIISVGSSSRLLVSSTDDKRLLHEGLDRLAVGYDSADMAAGLTLAASVAAQTKDSSIVVVSDGAVGDLSKLTNLPASLRYLSVGKPAANNRAITALAVREGQGGPQLLVGLANYGQVAASGTLTISVDGKLWSAKPLELQPLERSSITVDDLPRTASIIDARFNSNDDLATDDTAWTTRSGGKPIRTLLVSDGNVFIEKALGLMPNIELSKVDTRGYTTAGDVDIVVFDSMVPRLPATSTIGLLVINPQQNPNKPSATGDIDARSASAFNVLGRIEYPQIGPVQVGDPVMQYADFGNVQVAQAMKLPLPDWARALVLDREGNPLLYAGDLNGARIVTIAFDLHDSTIPLQVAFPILVSNIVDYIQPGATGSSEIAAVTHPGQPLNVALLPAADSVVFSGPDGKASEAIPVTNGQQQVSYAATGQPGIYSVRQYDVNGQQLGRSQTLAVNLFSDQESQIAASPSLRVAGQTASGSAQELSQREFWLPVIGIALLLAIVEWWIYFRGRSLPSLWRRAAS